MPGDLYVRTPMRYMILILTVVMLNASESNTVKIGGKNVLLDSKWAIIAHKPLGSITSVATQIPNPADEGTQDSTNLIVTIYDNKDAQAVLSFSQMILGIKDYKEERHGEWKRLVWSGKQGETEYSIIDCVLQKEGNPVTVFVRLAYPILKNNSKDYEKEIRNSLNNVLESIK